jgi:hypothetical protein
MMEAKRLYRNSIMILVTEGKVRALIINDDVRKTIKKLKAKAMDNIVNAADAVREDPEVLRDRNSAQTFTIPNGYKVTYTIERQPFGAAAHISISVNKLNKGPNPYAVEMILQEFGMSPLAQSVHAWVENITSTQLAINILQQLKDVKDVMGLGENDAKL